MKINVLNLAQRSFWACRSGVQLSEVLIDLLHKSLRDALKSGGFLIELDDSLIDGVPGIWDLEANDDDPELRLTDLDDHHIDLLMLLVVALFEIRRLLQEGSAAPACALAGAVRVVPTLFPEKWLDREAFRSELAPLDAHWDCYDVEIKEMLAALAGCPNAR